ncbi:unnamed protein product [Trypanosoma congolense IL3000]|uniref:WGS project CAEQ00000000 data, annotated contig 550 n=1 Tax=Trypanosoma congolense (strain IL3000) TaxID=1068625 RepID=F9WGU3_TRYCI|nr:unnamed protein product [Trypanosoma congolense IL3000]
MNSKESDSLRDTSNGESATSHTFSINAAPFEPLAGATSHPTEKSQERAGPPREQASAMGSSALWAPYSLQYYDMFMLSANMRALPQMGAVPPGGSKRYSGTPILRASSPVRRNPTTTDELKKLEKASLSIHAKPWSPNPDSGLSQEEGDTYIQLKKDWTKVEYDGNNVVAPVPFKEMGSLFVHSLTVRPLDKPSIHLELFNYLCARCATKSFFGRLSCRAADVIIKWVAADVPPLRIAHLLEQVTGATVSALFTEKGKCGYELWLENPEMSKHVVATVSGALWTCPMFHGYAVFAKADEEKAFLLDYINSLVEDFPEPTPYPMRFVEAVTSNIEEVNS